MSRLTKLQALEVSLVDKAANKRKFLVFKSHDNQGDGCMDKKQGTEEKKKEVSIMKEDGTPNFEAMPEDVRAEFQGIWKSHQDAIAKVAETELKLQKELDEKETQKFIAKATALDNLSIDTQSLGSILKDAAKNLSPKNYAELEKVLKSANDNAGVILKEFGHSNPDASTNLSALDELDRDAKAIVVAKSIGYYEAYALAVEAKPTLLNSRNKKV